MSVLEYGCGTLSGSDRIIQTAGNGEEVIIAKRRKDGWSVRVPGEFDGPFAEDIFADLNSEENELALEVRYELSELLVRANVDARARVIIWESGERLSIRESVQRLSQEFPECPFEMLEMQFVFWLLGFYDESPSRAQIAEYEELTEPWVKEYSRQYGFVY